MVQAVESIRVGLGLEEIILGLITWGGAVTVQHECRDGAHSLVVIDNADGAIREIALASEIGEGLPIALVS